MKNEKRIQEIRNLLTGEIGGSSMDLVDDLIKLSVEDVEELNNSRSEQEQEAEFYITIHNSAEGDWMYDIYEGDPIDHDDDSYSQDGGACTGSMLNALGMASKQANDMFQPKKS